MALRTVTPALDPEPAAQAWHWLHHEQTQALAELHRGGTCTLVLRHRTTTLTWTVRPVSYLPLAHRYGTPLPSCAEHFTARAQQPD
ncbi:hypothetical protein ABZ569_00720 [Streptomyces albus]|uniref:hypothetical protein n=1 Tax=Streptomyces albus TaxID=1888 RepID=UPI0033EB9851